MMDAVDFPYTLRRAGADNAPVIAHHRAAMFRDMREADEAAAAIIENASLDHIVAMIEAREYFGFLAEHEGEVVAGGGVWLRPVLPIPPGRWACIIRSPSHRSRTVPTIHGE